jgi:hypothetical protein
MRKFMVFASCVLMVMGMIAFGALPAAQAKPPQAQNGTTLAAYKTIDICDNGDGTWTYSGEIAVWNEGAIDTIGLVIEDCIQFKPFVGGGQFEDVNDLCQDLTVTEIPAGTMEPDATTFKYTIIGEPLTDGYIKNSAYLTILNHSGSIGTPKGPNPKATYDGEMPPPPCEQGMGCTYTQGYWENHQESWPNGFNPMDTFFLATKNGSCIANCGGNPNDDVFEQLPASWMDVLQASVNLSQGYYQLAHQYIAAVLNQANGASVPQGVQDTLGLASAWLNANTPSACTGPGSCGTQKDWAAVLDDYNNGVYDGGPPHCE